MLKNILRPVEGKAIIAPMLALPRIIFNLAPMQVQNPTCIFII
jgi:hypothetical protein